MKRACIVLGSTIFAYSVCAISGINRWAYIWLKSFYTGYVVTLWVVLAVIIVLVSGRLASSRTRRLLFGLGAGYVAGVAAYQLAPLIRDGSLFRVLSTIQAEGFVSYVGMSLVFPLLCLSPIAGFVAMVATSVAVYRSPVDRYIAGGTVAVLVIAGWLFFLSHTGVPVKW